MKRKRVVLTVQFDLDPIPGANHESSDAVRWLQRLLDNSIPHYKPEVDLDFVKDAGS
jgi:hypothetical protein